MDLKLEKVTNKRKVVPFDSNAQVPSSKERPSLAHSTTQVLPNNSSPTHKRSVTLAAAKNALQSNTPSPDKDVPNEAEQSPSKSISPLISSFLVYEKVVDLKKQIQRRREKKLKSEIRKAAKEEGSFTKQQTIANRRTSNPNKIRSASGSMVLTDKGAQNNQEAEGDKVKNGIQKASTSDYGKNISISSNIPFKKLEEENNDTQNEAITEGITITSHRGLLSSPQKEEENINMNNLDTNDGVTQPDQVVSSQQVLDKDDLTSSEDNEDDYLDDEDEDDKEDSDSYSPRKESENSEDDYDVMEDIEDVEELVEPNPFNKRKLLKKKQTLRVLDRKRLRESEENDSKFILYPDDKLRICWDIIILLALLYTAILMPVRLAFVDNNTGWEAVDWIMDAIFFIDIIVNFFSVYFDKDDNLVTSRRQIAKKYLLSWFIIDFLCVFPFQLFTQDENDDIKENNRLYKLARMTRLYRLVRTLKLIRIVKVYKDIRQFGDHMKSTVDLRPAYERLVMSIGGMLLFCHILGCIWFILTSLSDPAESWPDIYGLKDLSPFGQYIASVYYVVQTVITVGYGDITPVLGEERLLACFYMVIGVIYYSLFIGFLSSLVRDIESINEKFNRKLMILYRLQGEYNLPISFVKELLSAIKYQNKQTFNYEEFIEGLPKHLSVEVSYRMYNKIVEKIPFFQTRSKQFISFIGPLLRPMQIPKGEFIFRKDDPADEVFFIVSGKVAYVLPEYHNFEFLKIKKGYFFGEIDLLFYGEIRRYTAIAKKNCEFYVLNKKNFKSVFLMEFKDVGTELFENALQRKIRTRQVYKEALSLCSTHDNSPKKQEIKKDKHRLSVFFNNANNRPLSEQVNHNDDSADSEQNIDNKLFGIEELVDDEHESKTPHVDSKNPRLPLNSRMNSANYSSTPFVKKSTFSEAVHNRVGQVKGEKKLANLNKKMDMLDEKLRAVMSMTNNLKEKLSKGSGDNDKGKTPKNDQPTSPLTMPLFNGITKDVMTPKKANTEAPAPAHPLFSGIAKDVMTPKKANVEAPAPAAVDEDFVLFAGLASSINYNKGGTASPRNSILNHIKKDTRKSGKQSLFSKEGASESGSPLK